MHKRKFLEFSSLRFVVTNQQAARETLFIARHSRIYAIIQCGGPFFWKCLKCGAIYKFVKPNLRTPSKSDDPNPRRKWMTGSYILCLETWPESVHRISEEWQNARLCIRLEFEWQAHPLFNVCDLCVQRLHGSNLDQHPDCPSFEISCSFIIFLLQRNFETITHLVPPLRYKCCKHYNSKTNLELVTV